MSRGRPAGRMKTPHQNRLAGRCGALMVKKIAPAVARRKVRELERVIEKSQSQKAREAREWLIANTAEIAELPTDSTGEGSFRRDPPTLKEATNRKEAKRRSDAKLTGKRRRVGGYEATPA